jgi:predicted transcriptional regulator
MTESIPLTIRLSSDKAALLSSMADKQDRSRSYLLREAVDQYIEKHQRWVRDVEEAIEEADRGEMIDLEEAFDLLSKQ